MVMDARMNKTLRCKIAEVDVTMSLFDGKVTVAAGQKLNDTQKWQVQEFVDEANYIARAELYVDGLKHVMYSVMPRLGVTVVDEVPAEIQRMKPTGAE
jgi:hypothetical protein